jgi:hypothetical protein
MDRHVSEAETLWSWRAYDRYDGDMLPGGHAFRSRTGDTMVRTDEDAGSDFVHGVT